MWGSSARFQCDSLVRDSTVGLHCRLRVHPLWTKQNSPLQGPSWVPNVGLQCGLQDCVLYCVLLCKLHYVIYCTLYRCAVYFAVRSTSLQCGIPVGASTAGSPMGNVKPLVWGPCGDPLWVSSVRLDWGIQGWVPLQCGAPVWGSSVRLQCKLQDCVLYCALVCGLHCGLYWTLYSRLCNGLHWIAPYPP